MKHEEKIARIRLIRTQNIGPVTTSILLKRYKSGVEVIKQLPDIAKRSRASVTIATADAVEKELEAVTKSGGVMLVKGEEGYPAQLARFDDAPVCLSCYGHTHLFQKKAISIVGARNASANALALTEKLANNLGTAGFVIISGLARGIDAAAHAGALVHGTIGIMAGGIDQMYPRENVKLYEKMRTEGLVASEMPWGMQPFAQHFPIRNRIIASLCAGLLVTEASNRSGSLITAREASERGMEVMAIPGTPLDPRAAGCNALIAQGAALIQTADDIIQLMQQNEGKIPDPQPPLEFGFDGEDDGDTPSTPSEIEASKAELRDLLSYQATDFAELSKRSSFSARIMGAALFEMELAGEITRHHGNRISLIYRDEDEGAK
ncbi:MAG: DNA-processing protein DprA [Proteobacteria bacterium]|nr:DNA-processing protein DprA [Pseudomonadota bacterium]